MNGKGLFVAGTTVLGAVGLGYAVWRLLLLPQWAEGVDGVSDVRDEDVLDAGTLGREVAPLAALLGVCLVGMLLAANQDS